MIKINSASCHEAGHVVVGLFFDFRIEGIEFFEGRILNKCVIDASDRSDEERFIFLAGGIAGEKSKLGDYDPDGYKDDQQKISERGGESIESYLPDATKIIESNKKCFEELTQRIAKKALEKHMEMLISGGNNSFKLLTAGEIQQIWTACQPRR